MRFLPLVFAMCLDASRLFVKKRSILPAVLRYRKLVKNLPGWHVGVTLSQVIMVERDGDTTHWSTLIDDPSDYEVILDLIHYHRKVGVYSER